MSDQEKKPVTAEDIEALLEIFHGSSWTEMHLVAGGLELFVSNDPAASAPSHRTAPPAAAEPVRSEQPAPAARPSPPVPEAQAEVAPQEGLLAIKAPNLGVFYAAPKPGADPYVQVGTRVEEDTPVGLIEVMKLFTTIYAGVRGTVRDIRVSDGEMVEFDQVMMLVEPAD